MFRPAICIVLAFILSASVTASAADAPWFEPVKGHVAPAAGEHPRLLFRKADLPELRRRAATPEGKKMVALLRETLGKNGDTFTDVFNPNPTVNTGAKGPDALPIGAFTMGHGAGYGYLYVLTGDKKYADLAKQAVQKLLDGQPDRDERYAWVKPGTGFRFGMVLMNVAMAYDFCYDAWDADFRLKVVKAIQENQNACLQHKRPLSLETMANANGYPPGSNHFGAYIGGTGMAVLAIQGDPGADDKRLAKVLDTVEKNLTVVLTRGFGDGGWFAEGNHPGRVSSNTGFVPLIQALRVARGRDYAANRPNADAVTTIYAYLILPKAGVPNIPFRGDYGNELLYGRSTMLSHMSEFSQGFGAVSERYRPAMLWVYNHFVEPGEQKNYNSAGYPTQVVMSLINWPIGEKEKNPADVLPLAHRDSIHNYYAFRNRWQDDNDILITLLAGGGPGGYKRVPGGQISVWGLGMRTTFPVNLSGVKADLWEPTKTGGQLAGPVRGGTCALAVDFSKTSGAEAVIVMAGPDVPGAKMNSAKGPGGATAVSTAVKVGSVTYYVQTLQTGPAPEVKPDGDGITVGKQRVTFDGKRVTFWTSK